MREREKQAFQLSFNRVLRVDFQGSRVTSDGGLILVRELDERLGLGELASVGIAQAATPKKTIPIIHQEWRGV